MRLDRELMESLQRYFSEERNSAHLGLHQLRATRQIFVQPSG